MESKHVTWVTRVWFKMNCTMLLGFFVVCFLVFAEKPSLQLWQEISPNILA